MAKVTNTFDTYSAVGNRETLADIIHNISPEDTPFTSLVGRETVKGAHPEWQTDVLATPSGSNAKLQGNEWAIDATTPTKRVANFTQISEKSFGVTGTQEAVDKAGRKSELKYQAKKKGIELRKDMEAAALSNKASVAGDGSTAPQLGGLPSWLYTNGSCGANGVAGYYSSNSGLTVAAVNGTQRAFAKADLDTVLTATYTNGGNPDTIMLSPYNKTVFSGFTTGSIAQLRSEAKTTGKMQQIIFSGVDTYASEFGVLHVVPNRVMTANTAIARNVFVIDSDMAKIGILRDIQMHDVAKVGDAERKVLNVEYSLLVKNEAAFGIIADTFGTNANT